MPIADESCGARRSCAEEVASMRSTSPIQSSTRQATQPSSHHKIQTATRQRTFKTDLQHTDLTQTPSDRIVRQKLNRIQRLAYSPTDAAIPSEIRETEVDTKDYTSHFSSEHSPLANSLSIKLPKISSTLEGNDGRTSVVENEKPRKRKRSVECQSQYCSDDAEYKTNRAKGDPPQACHISNCEQITSQSSTKTYIKVHVSPEQEKSKNSNVDSEVFQNSAISELQKPQKRMRTNCQCPNCSVEGGNNKRHFNGRLLHACHHPDCGKCFDKIARLKDHLRCHSGENPYMCSWSAYGKSFARKNHLIQHISSHEKLSKYPGVNCSVESVKKTKVSNDRPQHVCHIPGCSRVFRNSWNLKRHLNVHSGMKNFYCAHCDKGFARKDVLISHLRVHIPKPKKQLKCRCPNCSVEGGNETRGPNGNILHVCHYPDCGKVFAKAWNLKTHLNLHKGVKDFVCPHCSKEFARKSHWKKHLQTHANSTQTVLKDGGFKSPPSSSTNEVENSQKRKRINRRYRNHEAEASEGSRINFSVENGNKIKNSNDRLQWICRLPGCGRVFSYYSSFKRHLKVHNGTKNFFCAHCGKGFARKDTLNQHLDIHNGTKPFFCAHCGKKFARKMALQSHVQIHTPGNTKRLKFRSLNRRTEGDNKLHEQNPSALLYLCHYPNCGRVFAMLPNLRTHLKLHSAKKDFLCPHCNMKFTHKSSLKMHLRTHANATPKVLKDDSVKISQSLSINEVEKSQKRKKTKCKCLYCIVEGCNKNRNLAGRLLHKCHIPECGKVFSTTSHLKLHLRSCQGGKLEIRFSPLTLLGLRTANTLQTNFTSLPIHEAT